MIGPSALGWTDRQPERRLMPVSRFPSLLLAAGLLLSHGTMAMADDGYPAYGEAPKKQFVLELGGGLIAKPKYPGASDYIISPFPIVSIGRFYLPGVGQVADGEVVMRGFYFYPSFDFTGKRKASDSADLTGTNTVDWSVELGLGVGYRYDWFRAFVEVRQGFNGHSGQVADFGADIIAQPFDRVEVAFGPRASWASNDYMDTYFGVTPAESAAPGSILAAYNPGSGFKTVGLAAEATYALTDSFDFHLRGSWDRFVGDAAKSPIVKAGSKDQFTIGAGLSYRLAFDLFE